ncbi:MAG: hypothetical protein AAGA57_06735 [Planctomycetota bacterium]
MPDPQAHRPTPTPADASGGAPSSEGASNRAGIAAAAYLVLAFVGVTALWNTAGPEDVAGAPAAEVVQAASPTPTRAPVARVALDAIRPSANAQQTPTPSYVDPGHARRAAAYTAGPEPAAQPVAAPSAGPATAQVASSDATAPALRPLRVDDLAADTGEIGPFGLELHEDDLRIVYVVDASGSLVDRFPFVLAELATSIETLAAHRSFAVIFFRDGRPIELDTLGLRSATGSAKRVAAARLQPETVGVAPDGQTDPRAALRRAMAYRPDRVFLVSDNLLGAGAEPRRRGELLADFEFANGSGARISTVQLLDRDPLQRYGFEPLLKAIARRHGGEYRQVSSDDLGLEPVLGDASAGPDWLLP